MPAYERTGLRIAVILAQACDRITRAFARWAVSYPFPVLCDADRAVTKRYGVWHPIGLDAFNTAHPASFLIDAERRIRYAFVGSSQFARAPLDRILDVARAAPASPQG